MVMRYEGLKEKLDKEYLLVFEKIELYTQMHHINEKKQAESLMDLMDVFLESQTNKKDINDIIGEDIETFCENYFSEYGAKERVIDILLYFKRLVLVVFVLELFFLIGDASNNNFHFWTSKTDVSGYFIGLFAGIFTSFIVDLIFKYSFNKFKKLTKIKYVISTLVGVLLMLGVIISLGSETVIEVKIWPVLLVCGLYLLIFYVYRYYHRYKNTKSFKKEKSEYEMTFKEMVESELSETNIKEVKDYTKIFAKRMHKMNKKLEKKGKPIMSMDAFFNRLEKENKWGKMAYIITMILIVFPMIVDEFQKNAWFDALGLLVLLLIINYFVYRFMGNVYKIGNYYQSIVYQECIRLNMSFEEYYDYLNEEYKD